MDGYRNYEQHRNHWSSPPVNKVYNSNERLADGEWNIRVILANWILNFEWPRDLYVIIFWALSTYFTYRLFRFVIRIVVSMIRPILFISLLVIAMPYFYELKTTMFSSRTVNDIFVQLHSFLDYITDNLSAIYKNTTKFYAKTWLNYK